MSCVSVVVAGNLACRNGWLGVDWPSDGDPMVRERLSDGDVGAPWWFCLVAAAGEGVDGLNRLAGV